MAEQLTIEGAEAVALAAELSALTGESVGTAVLETLRAGVRQRRQEQDEFQRLMAVTETFRQSLTPPFPSSSHDWLYDDAGLPL